MKKKILFLTGCLAIGGSEKSLISFLDYMDYSKYECHILLLGNRDELLPQLNKNVIVHRLSKDNPYFDVPYKECLQRAIKTKKYGMIYYGTLNAIFKNSTTKFAKRFTASLRKRALPLEDKFDIAITFDSHVKKFLVKNIKADLKIMRQSDGTINNATKKDIELFKKIDKVVTLTPKAAEFINLGCKVPKEKITVVGSNFNNEEILKDAEEYKVERGAKFVFTTTQRIVPLKNYEMIIHGLKYLCDHGFEDIKCYAIGDGDLDHKEYPAKVKNLAKELGVSDKIEFVGAKINPLPYVKACDIYFQPSNIEGLPRSVVEAFILGKPCLCAANVGCEFLIKPGENGEIVPVGDIQGFSEKLLYMVENLEEIKAKQVPLRVDNEKVMEEYYKLFEE